MGADMGEEKKNPDLGSDVRGLVQAVLDDRRLQDLHHHAVAAGVHDGRGDQRLRKTESARVNALLWEFGFVSGLAILDEHDSARLPDRLLALLDIELPTWRDRAWGQLLATHVAGAQQFVFWVGSVDVIIGDLLPPEPWERAVWLTRAAVYRGEVRPELGRRLWEACTREPQGAGGSQELARCAELEIERAKLAAQLDALRKGRKAIEAALALLPQAMVKVWETYLGVAAAVDWGASPEASGTPDIEGKP